MTATTTAATTVTPAGRIVALAATEIQLILRNRTTAVSSVLAPLGLGLVWASAFGSAGDPPLHGVVLALQLTVVLAMGLRDGDADAGGATPHARAQADAHQRPVRPRSPDRDGGAERGARPRPARDLRDDQRGVRGTAAARPRPVGGRGAGRPRPRRHGRTGHVRRHAVAGTSTDHDAAADVALLGGASVLSVAPLDGWWQALVAVPGAAVGQLVQLAMTGGAWSAGLGGLPAVLPAAVALIVWSVVSGWLAVRRFRWDPRR